MHLGVTLRRVAEAAATLSARWDDEYELRRCGQLAAAAANLRAAASLMDGDKALRTDRRWSAVADEFSTTLWKAYPNSLPLDAASLCRSHGPNRLAAFLRTEHHPGQAANWPNYVVAFQEESDSPVVERE